jgi:hypothetical protein
VTEARAKRASPYRRGEWAERDRWVRAAYVVLQCSEPRRAPDTAPSVRRSGGRAGAARLLARDGISAAQGGAATWRARPWHCALPAETVGAIHRGADAMRRDEPRLYKVGRIWKTWVYIDGRRVKRSTGKRTRTAALIVARQLEEAAADPARAAEEAATVEDALWESLAAPPRARERRRPQRGHGEHVREEERPARAPARRRDVACHLPQLRAARRVRVRAAARAGEGRDHLQGNGRVPLGAQAGEAARAVERRSRCRAAAALAEVRPAAHDDQRERLRQAARRARRRRCGARGVHHRDRRRAARDGARGARRRRAVVRAAARNEAGEPRARCADRAGLAAQSARVRAASARRGRERLFAGERRRLPLGAALRLPARRRRPRHAERSAPHVRDRDARDAARARDARADDGPHGHAHARARVRGAAARAHRRAAARRDGHRGPGHNRDRRATIRVDQCDG